MNSLLQWLSTRHHRTECNSVNGRWTLYFQVLTEQLNKKSSRCDIMFNEPVTCISFSSIVKSLQFHYLGTYVLWLFSPHTLSINFYPVPAIDDYYKSSPFCYIPCCSYLRHLGLHLNYFNPTWQCICYVLLNKYCSPFSETDQ
jgi:hypothetical protein